MTLDAQAIADRIRAGGGYHWVGIYDVGAEDISILAWSGERPPTHTRFAKDRGLCGAAAASGRTVVVGDVTKDSRYLTTFENSRSEIIVPVKLASGDVVGLIDVESEKFDAFGPSDVHFLEDQAEEIARSRR